MMKIPVEFRLSIAVFFLILFDVTQTDDRDETCYTKTCQKMAEVYSVSMNRSADPCNDFYSYTCGSLESAYLRNDEILKSVPNSESKETAKLLRLGTIRASCVNSSENADRESLSDILAKLGFNLELENGHWQQTGQYDWINTTEILVDNYFRPDFFFKIQFLGKEPYIMVLQYDDFIEENEEYDCDDCTEDEILTLRKNYSAKFLTDISKLIFDNTDIDNFFNDIFRGILSFKKSLTWVTNNNYESERTLTIKNLSMIAPSILWLPFVQTTVRSMADLTVTENDSIFIESMEFIEEFERLISTTPGNVLLNYIAYRLHALFLKQRQTSSHIGSDYGINENPFDDIMSTLRLSETLTPEDKSMREYVKNLAEKIRFEFLDVINNKWHWMGKIIQEENIKNLQSTPVVVVYRDFTAADQELMHEYENLQLEDHTCWFFGRQMNNLKLKLMNNRLISQNKSLNCHNFNSTNLSCESEKYTQVIEGKAIIYISLAALRNYNINDRPEYMNLVTVGWDIARIMAYPSTVMEFFDIGWKKIEAAKRCFMVQYNNYTSEDRMHDPSRFKDIMRLNIGLDIVHRLYRKWLNTTETLQWKLPNYNDTLDEMFFISAGLRQCQNNEEIVPVQYVFQLVGQNFPEFSEVFSCKKGTTMNPEKKCKLQI